MHIDNPDALIHWLTGYLPPLCDADPVVLAKYCFALVKKDRPEDELKASLNEQLDVFLKSNTILFVDKLLEVARTKSYLPKDAPVPVKSNATSSDDKVESSDSVPAEAAAPEEAKSAANVTSSSPAPQSTEAPQPPLPAVPPPSQSVPHPPPEIAPPLPTAKSEPASDPTVKSKKPTNEREKDGERRHRKSVRTTDRSRTKSRSRSRERDRRRSRSRGRSGRNKFDDRRRRSPHAKRHGGYCRRSRSPRFSASPSRRSRSRDRRSRSWNKSASSPKRRGGARSRSPKNAASRKETSPVAKTSPAPQERNGSQSPENTESVSVQSVISVPGKLERYSVSSARSKRCRDYDEQGFCMKGDHCPFDHGSDPVVLEGGALDFPPPVPRVPPMTYRVPAPSLPQRAFTRPPPPRPNEFGEYTPNKPDLWTGDSIVASAPHFSSRGGRRIIAVPPPRFSAPPPPIGLGVSVNGTGGGLQKNYDRPSLAERLGQTMEQHPSGHVPITVPPPSHIPKFSGGPDNVTLELRKVPAGLNTITNLNQHFAKFGNIVNIQIHYNGDPEASLVTFSSHSEASAAYKSTEAVLNNRFIKLFWHNAARREVPSSTTNVQRGRDRMPVRNPNKSLNNRVPQINEVASSSSKDKVMLTKEGLKKTVFNATAAKPSPADDGSAEPPSDAAAEAEAARKQLTSVEIKKQEIETIRKQQELLKAEILARQKQEKAKTEALKLKTEVENRAKQLLKEQMQHVKLLITKLETNRATMKPEEVKLMLQTIKSLQAAIETTKAQLASSMAPPASAPAPAPTKPQPKKIKTQLEKEILDTEMELYSIKSDGMDLSQIKSRLVELKAKAGQLKAQKSYAQGLRRVLPNNRPLLRGVRGSVRGSRARGRAGRHYGSFGGHGSVAPAAAVDRRTTTIDASGFEREDKMEVLAHFTALGTISTFSWDDLTPAVTVQFATRKEAEKAMTDGRHLGDRLLTLTWVSNLSSKLTSPTSSGGPVVDVAAKPSRSRSSSFSTSPARSSQDVNASALVSQTDDEIEITEEIVEEIETEEIVDCFDEEEDGSEEGDRSWRR